MNRVPLLAIECDSHGMVRTIVRDDGGLMDGAVGRPFPSVVPPISMRRAFDLLERTRTESAVTGFTLPLAGDDGPVNYTFAATRSDNRIWLVAGTGDDEMLAVIQDLMRINNEHANALRQALAAARSRAGAQELDEMMALNNEMADVQRQLAQKNAELERANQQKNAILGTVSHDLRNPIAVISGYARFLDGMPGDMSDEQRQFARSISTAADYMLALVNDLLDVSAIEAGELKLHPSPTDPVALMNRVIELERPIATRKGIHLELSAPERVPPLNIDAPKMEQVLHNLVSNAVKFSHVDTTIRVSIAADASFVRLAVADEGQGIPADEVDKLFVPFATTSVRSTAGERSTGLGLAIVNRIVQGHGGKIDVASEVGAGSTFTVVLPREGAPD